jgi:hypothetical protein
MVKVCAVRRDCFCDNCVTHHSSRHGINCYYIFYIIVIINVNIDIVFPVDLCVYSHEELSGLYSCNERSQPVLETLFASKLCTPVRTRSVRFLRHCFDAIRALLFEDRLRCVATGYCSKAFDLALKSETIGALLNRS